MNLPRSYNERYENDNGTIEWVAVKDGVPVRSVTTDVERNTLRTNWEQLTTDYATQPVLA